MKEIKLNKGFTTQVDDEDYEYLNQWKWRVAIYKHTNYARRTLWIKGENRSITLHMHRIILNPPKNMEIDHKDQDGLNNQRSNLRICTGSQNHMNKKPIGKYVGVAWYKYTEKWKAQIHVNGKQLHLGYFKDDGIAARVRDEAAKKYFGEFAVLNFKD